MKLFIYILHECGVRVPTFHGFKQLQSKIRQTCGIPTIPCKSPQGNLFWMIDPRAILAKDWANPDIRPEIHVYPEIPDGPLTEVWHTERWHKGMDRGALSPMYDAVDKHYYIDELCQLRNGEFVAVTRWVIYHGALHAEVHRLMPHEEGTFRVDQSITDMVPVEYLDKNLFDLEAANSVPQLDGMYGITILSPRAHPESLSVPTGTPRYNMANPLRELAGGDPLYSTFINHFADDVSGNRSKSYNKHMNAYITHANLPRRFLQQEAHIHFISTSPHASASEQFLAFKTVVESTHTEPVKVFDPTACRQTRFRIFVNAEPSDNPMQSEISSHIGGKGNRLCRKCDVGGTTLEKETNEGFHALFTPGTPRTKDGVLRELRAQYELACLGVEKAVRNRQTETGIKDAHSQPWIDDLIRRARRMKKDFPSRTDREIQAELMSWVDANAGHIYNPFLTLQGLDPMLDTPVELLHTVLLGVVKYIWYWSHTSWSPAQKATYAQRLQGTNTDGLSVHAIRSDYIVQYANSLIGRQLKTIVQSTSFHVHDILSPLNFALWLAVGEMTALLWFPEIHDLAEYKQDLQVAIANVLDLFAEIDPTKVVDKVKLHILSHTLEDVARFGPLLNVITESFESFNGIFRSASIGSNHLAPSRDIANQLADQEALKHRLMGGFWPLEDGTWVRAGARIRDFLNDRPGVQGIVGWRPQAAPKPGSVKVQPVPNGLKNRPMLCLGGTVAHLALNSHAYDLDVQSWQHCQHVISQAGDTCREGSWICVRSPLNDDTLTIGRIHSIFRHSTDGDANTLVILDIFEVAAHRHPLFQMPFITRRFDEPSFVIVKGWNIQFAFNAQHDCAHAGCAATATRPVRQERVDSDTVESYIEHRLDVARYIINIHSLHNPHLIRRALPRDLTAPIPRFEDRRAAHDKMARNLQQVRGRKRAEAVERKAQAKKTKSDAMQSGGIRSEDAQDARQTGTSSKSGGLVPEPDGEMDAGDAMVHGSVDARVASFEVEPQPPAPEQQPKSRVGVRPRKRPRGNDGSALDDRTM
ncbi:hypothetical protein FKP32DRAFT_1714529 [Trametes sanguinea]|nr:hypothetical protein FKP32DRAFT_1714529 [Trametes sanguinea]